MEKKHVFLVALIHSLILSPFVAAMGYVYAELEQFESVLLYIAANVPLYVLSAVGIYVFLKHIHIQKRCSIFALPISYALLPIVLFFVADLVLIGWCLISKLQIWFLCTALYVLPLFLVTLGIAVFVNIRNRKADNVTTNARSQDE